MKFDNLQYDMVERWYDCPTIWWSKYYFIYQDNNWTIKWWDDHTIIPSCHRSILKIVVFLESSAICYSAHFSYLKKNNKSKPPPQTNFRALLSNHQCPFNCTILNVIVCWGTALTTQNSQYIWKIYCRNRKAEIWR